MKENVKKVIAYGILLIIITGIVWVGFSFKQKVRTGWVDINKLYNEFELKKELESTLEITREQHKKVLDSLEFDIILMSKASKDALTNRVIEAKKEYYIKRKRSFDVDDENQKNQYQTQILTQINQFVKDYGEKNGYAYIVGADGTGTVMYADEHLNLTNELKVYINERYKGLQK
jgi:outer membrane protein